MPPGESPYKDPLDIAVGLHELSRFLKSSGFPQAGALVAIAAQSAWAQIARVRAKIEPGGQPARGSARRRGSAEIIALGARRRRPEPG